MIAADDRKKRIKAAAGDNSFNQIPKTISEKSPSDVLFKWNNGLGLLLLFGFCFC